MKLPRPEFGGRRLLLVASGAVSAMHMPFWLNWLEHGYPDLEVKLVLTRSAERFVSRESLGLLVENEALPDRWPETNGGEGALHIALKEWHDCALVFPACLNYLSRMAQGAADSPSLLALQCSSAPIVVAPSVPQGALDNPIVTANLDRLRLRPNLRLAPTGSSKSLTTRRKNEDGIAPMWEALPLLEELRTNATGEKDGPAEAAAPSTSE